jgi:DNA-binding XRE family transcriptional regulator
MPNIGTLLKEEISRLSRREVRTQVKATKKGTAQHRRSIAALKRQVTKLERQVSLLEQRVLGAPPVAPVSSNTARARFVAKGLRSQRDRLGLSAADYGRLVGVSAQSIYNWERESASPRPEQVRSLAAFRGIGKREAQARLQQLRAKGAKAHRRP